MHYTMPAALLIASALSAGAQINSPAPDGYLTRAEKMYNDHNYKGSLDQLSHLRGALLTPDEAEQAAWVTALATMRAYGPAAAEAQLEAFERDYPASLRRQEARLRLGDCKLEASVSDALAIYKDIDAAALSGALQRELAYKQAYCYVQLGEFDEARTRFERLSGDKAYGSASRFYLGYIAYSAGDFAAAEAQFATTDKTTAPGNMADYYLAQIYYKRGDWSRASQMATALLRRTDIAPQYEAEATRIAGETAYRQGKSGEAMKMLNKYMSMVETPELSALYIVGLDKYMRGDYGKAVELLRPVTQGNDAMAQSAYLYIGQALAKDGDTSAALMAFEKALRMDYDLSVQEAAYYNYAVAKMTGAKVPFGSTAATFEDFLRRYPNSRYAPEVQSYIVTGYLTDDDYEGALGAIRRMSAPTDEVLGAKQRILYTLGLRSMGAGRDAEAVDYLKQAEALKGYDAAIGAETSLTLGEAMYRTGDYDGAVTRLNEYLNGSYGSERNRAVARYDLGYARFARKEYGTAEVSFNKVVSSGKLLGHEVVADAYNRLGDIKYMSKDFSAASELYGKAYKENEKAGDYALFMQALMKGYNRDHKGKIAGLKRLEQEFAQSTLMPDALLEMTESYIQLGDNAGAIDVYRRLVKEYPNTSQGRQGYLQMALTLINAGRKSEGVEAYKEVIRRYPTSDEAAEAAESLKRICADAGTLDEYAAFISGVANAPSFDAAEADKLTYEAAEKQYLNDLSTAKLRTYVERYPSGRYAAQALGYLLEDARDNGNMSAAAQYASQIISRYPDNRVAETAYLVAGAAALDKGRANDALQSYKAAAERASSSTVLNAARAGVMRSAMAMGRYDEALDAASALLSSSTTGSEDKDEAAYTKAEILSHKGDVGGARSIWSELSGRPDAEYGARSCVALGESYLAAKDYAKAMASVEQLINSGTSHTYWLARAFIVLSDVYAAEGKSFEAREYLQSLRENYPGKEPDIKEMIDKRLRDR